MKPLWFLAGDHGCSIKRATGNNKSQAWWTLLDSISGTRHARYLFLALISVCKMSKATAATASLAGAEKMMMMGFPMMEIDHGSVSDRVLLACS